MIENNKEIILNIRNKKIILLSRIIIISFIIVTIITHFIEVQNYYQNKGIIVLDEDKYYLKLYIDITNINDIINNSSIIINDIDYNYSIIKKSDLLESNYNNYQIFYLQVPDLNKNLLINNLVIDYKILIHNQLLIKYIKNKVKE